MSEDFSESLKAIQEAMKGTFDKLEDAPAEKVGEGWHGRVCGFCPVQGFGTVDGFEWYFRARYDDWSFRVHAGGDDLFSMGKEYEGDASWMPYSDAWQYIEEGITIFRSTQKAVQE